MKLRATLMFGKLGGKVLRSDKVALAAKFAEEQEKDQNLTPQREVALEAKFVEEQKKVKKRMLQRARNKLKKLCKKWFQK